MYTKQYRVKTDTCKTILQSKNLIKRNIKVTAISRHLQKWTRVITAASAYFSSAKRINRYLYLEYLNLKNLSLSRMITDILRSQASGNLQKCCDAALIRAHLHECCVFYDFWRFQLPGSFTPGLCFQ